MLKKCVAIACTAVLGGAMIVGFAGCSDTKKPANPPANAPTGTEKPADGAAPPTNPPPADDHK